MRDGFIFYKSYYDAMQKLPEAEFCRLMHAVCDFAYNGVTPELDGVCDLVFGLIAPTLTAACKRHDQAVKGGKARWAEKPAAEAPKPLKKPHNVKLTPGQLEALAKEVENAQQVLDSYSAYKEKSLPSLVFDDAAVRFFANNGHVPAGWFTPKEHPAETARKIVQNAGKQ